MDRKHGKRSLPLEEEEEEEEKPFPIYSSRSQQDMVAVISALVQVMGGKPVHQDPLLTVSTSCVVANDSNQQSQPPPRHQGMFNSLPSYAMIIYTAVCKNTYSYFI